MKKYYRRVFSEEEVALIVQLYKNKQANVNEIRAMFKCGCMKIIHLLKEHNVNIVYMTESVLTKVKNNLDYFLELYQGKSIKQIAREDGLNHLALTKAFKELKIPIYNNVRRFSDNEIIKILDMYVNNRQTLLSISRFFHTSNPAIKNVLITNGAHIRDRFESARWIDRPVRTSGFGTVRGYCGKYKGWHFRSLDELSFCITELEGKNIEWQSAETKDFFIFYSDCNGKIHRYHADFVTENKEMIEIKPQYLHNDPLVIAKSQAAEGFCEKQGLIYKIIDHKKDLHAIKREYQLGNINFSPRKKESTSYLRLMTFLNNENGPFNL